MKNGNLSRYYLFSITNLLAAFGGGLILGQGLGVIDIPYLQHGSVLAFFVGTIFGLIFLNLIPNKFSKTLSQSFSICCATTSVILFCLFESFSLHGKLSGNIGLIFFALLCVRFGFWFYSRVIRASNASGQQQSIAWVELGYYSGMILGLVIWKLLQINIDLSAALIIDASFQFIAGILDFKGNAIVVPEISNQSDVSANSEKIPLFNLNPTWLWKLSLSVVLLTIGVQVVIFNLSHHVAESFGVYILAIFYFGVASAAYVANKLKMLLFWCNNVAYIEYNKIKKINLLFAAGVSAIFVILSAFIANSNIFNNEHYRSFFICAFIFFASFIYETMSLAILDRIGYEENNMHSSGMIMKTYGLMGLGAAIGLWCLGTITNNLDGSIIMVCGCFSIAVGLIRKRKSTNLNALEITGN